ncbi:hypothetical protein PVA45_07220 (plasmid) [Entomospira entomophila]|uniref:Baseplate hub protein gp44/GpP-like second domain-containing protein n=1 Tax=Entomospira entomophila TaxID=2719988 RepID=A0A968GDA3_9SPIO|nr:hypothetical protein [Entomospira entomophilus]NIZ41351.1 hypothetical protein [Entomospira entomophilus]WDI36238.1 hypothetical protein PVA45_07220 [Entomospira entomophilus]
MANHLTMAQAEKIKLEIDRTLIDGFIAVSLRFQIQEFSAGFAIELLGSDRMQWIKPFTYQEVRIYYDQELLITGRIEKVSRTNAKTLQIEGRSLPALLIDTMLKPPLQFHDMTLETLVKEVAKPFNIEVRSEVTVLANYPKITASIGTTIFAFMNCVAENDNILMTSDPNGDIMIQHYKFDGIHKRLIAGEDGYLDANISFDGSDRFSSLTLMAQSEEDLELTYTIEDPSISLYRPLVEVAEASDLATLENIAKRRLTLSIAKSITLTLKLLGWQQSDIESRLLRVGDMIQIQDTSLNLPKLTTFVIEGLTLGMSSGDLSMDLSLAIPNLYTGEPLEGEMPWQ